MEYSILTILIVLNIVMTAARSGFLNLRRAKLLSLEETQETTIAQTLELASKQTHLRASLKLAQNLIRVSMAGILLVNNTLWEFGSLSTISIIIILTIFVLINWMIEFLVESIVNRNPELWAIRLTSFARFLVLVFSPLLSLLFRVSGEIISDTSILVSVDEDGIQALLDAGLQAGIIDSDEHQMIHRIFELDETIAREIMIPRTDMLSLDINTPFDEAADILLKSGFSRVPVYEEHIDDILGILYTKDILKILHAGNQTNSIRSLLRPANFIPELAKIDKVREKMQAEHIHIAILVDEFGGVAGLVTLEDIVEEIFGEIQDEYDDAEEPPSQKIDEGEFIFLGRIELDEFNEIMEAELESKGTDTLGGFIYERINRQPRVGDKIVEGDLHLTVKEARRHRVQKVHARWEKQSIN